MFFEVTEKPFGDLKIKKVSLGQNTTFLLT